MACKTSFELHHNFPKLAEESGFTFNTHKPRVHLEWNKIKLIDIESLIKDRKFVIVEQHINDILDCVLESEFDVRILDEGVLKIFRLAQLAVEYQQFCRHYLDRSVYVLRQEVTNLLKELDTIKKNLQEKEEDIRRIKRKSKQYSRTSLPYGNENIATMLLKTLNQNHGDAFNSTSQLDMSHYNKCTYCDKIFLNQLYLKSHISRRHANVDIPQKDTEDINVTKDHGNSKVNEEISELKRKLEQMESLITNTHNNNYKNVVTVDTQTPDNNNEKNCNDEKLCKEMKDVSVITNDTYMLNKIEEWKNVEYEKYNKEINLLRNQIIDIVSKKQKEDESIIQKELNSMEHFQMTIKQQGEEIIALKQELLRGESIEKEKRKEIEAQMTNWIKKTEMQSNEYKALLQKLDDVANEAKECRARAEAEKERSSKLEEILEGRLKKQTCIVTETPQNPSKLMKKTKKENDNSPEESNKTKQLQKKATYPIANKADSNTLKKLQEKAYELLNIDQSSSTDISSISDEKTCVKLQKTQPEREIRVENSLKLKEKKKGSRKFDRTGIKKKQEHKSCNTSIYEQNSKPTSHATSKTTILEHSHVSCSPVKIIRAKITEEVNHHLTSLGLDPFKNSLPQNIYQKQRTLLQREREMKAKKFPAREKILHSIINNLDEKTPHTTILQKEVYISSDMPNKNFNFSSVLTNVKTKALSLVKSNEPRNKSEKSYKNVAKKAIAMLKTPPGSARSSPLRSEKDFTSNKTVKHIDNARKEAKHDQPQTSTKTERKIHEDIDTNDDSDIATADGDDLIDDQTAKINHLIKSPVRHPINKDLQENCKKPHSKNEITYKLNIEEESSNEIESIEISPKYLSQENINSPKQTKGVLKNASSTSSLNKKKVLFDMEAIQMKSVSASPSQSITDKSGNIHELFETDGANLDTEEWDISSIENEPTQPGTKIQNTSNKSTKIAELKKTIESKLAYRSPTLSTALVGGVDVLAAPIQRGASFGGSNTSLGSSILDETDHLPVQNNTFVVKSKTAEKDDSEIEISDLINDTVDNKRYIKSF